MGSCDDASIKGTHYTTGGYTVVIQRRSAISGKVNTMDLPVTEAQVSAWRNGGLIQEVMPHLNAEEREFLISGVTPEEWEGAFGGLED